MTQSIQLLVFRYSTKCMLKSINPPSLRHKGRRQNSLHKQSKISSHITGLQVASRNKRNMEVLIDIYLLIFSTVHSFPSMLNMLKHGKKIMLISSYSAN